MPAESDAALMSPVGIQLSKIPSGGPAAVGTYTGRETRLTDGGGAGGGVMFGEVEVADKRSDEVIKLGSGNKKKECVESCVSIRRWYLGFEALLFSSRVL